ncbi:MAG: hypothetical protein Q8909_07445 [Bacteroidota bacterium]|nr:hypothetical protein [Bacteroidota bacterium]
MSTFVLIGYCLFFVVMPIPATLLEFKPVIFNLKNPIDTFTHISLILWVLIGTFVFYKRSVGSRNVLRPLFNSLGLYDKFKSKEIWALAILALVTTAINIIIFGRWASDDKLVDKPLLLDLLSKYGPFMNVPLLFLFPSFNIIQDYTTSSRRWLIVLFAILLFIIGVASNVRTMAVSFVSLALFAALLMWLMGQIHIKIKKQYLVLVFLCGYFFTGPFSDLSLAMVMVRGEKNGISGMELLSKTLDAYQDKKELNAFKNMLDKSKVALGKTDWDESYIDNDLLARFCSVKTIDESIFYAKKIGFANDKMQIDYKNQMVAMLPASICELFFGMNRAERSDITSYSETDYLYAIATNNKSGLGSFRIGSLAGIGLSIFSYGYLFIIMGIFFILFFLFDSTVRITEDKGVVFSLWSFCNILLIGYITSCGHNFYTEVRYIVRGFWESVFFYMICVFLLKKLVWVFSVKNIKI